MRTPGRKHIEGARDDAPAHAQPRQRSSTRNRSAPAPSRSPTPTSRPLPSSPPVSRSRHASRTPARLEDAPQPSSHGLPAEISPGRMYGYQATKSSGRDARVCDMRSHRRPYPPSSVPGARIRSAAGGGEGARDCPKRRSLPPTDRGRADHGFRAHQLDRVVGKSSRWHVLLAAENGVAHALQAQYQLQPWLTRSRCRKRYPGRL